VKPPPGYGSRSCLKHPLGLLESSRSNRYCTSIIIGTVLYGIIVFKFLKAEAMGVVTVQHINMYEMPGRSALIWVTGIAWYPYQRYQVPGGCERRSNGQRRTKQPNSKQGNTTRSACFRKSFRIFLTCIHSTPAAYFRILACTKDHYDKPPVIYTHIFIHAHTYIYMHTHTHTHIYI
jgi:hypothetical protein